MSFWTLTPRRILWDVVAIAEVIVSIVVHLSYGLSIFGCAVWIDVMSILSASSSSNSTPPRHNPKKRDSSDDELLVQALHSPVVTTVLHQERPDDGPDHHHGSQLGLEEVAEENKKQQQLATIATTEELNRAFLDGHQKAPIVLVHGIFGFGKGRLGSLSYWGGAEQRDDRILVPDLGALTSIHDRFFLTHSLAHAVY